MLICTNCYYIALLPLIPTPILYTITIDARDQLAARPTAAAVIALLIFPLYRYLYLYLLLLHRGELEG